MQDLGSQGPPAIPIVRLCLTIGLWARRLWELAGAGGGIGRRINFGRCGRQDLSPIDQFSHTTTLTAWALGDSPEGRTLGACRLGGSTIGVRPGKLQPLFGAAIAGGARIRGIQDVQSDPRFSLTDPLTMCPSITFDFLGRCNVVSIIF